MKLSVIIPAHNEELYMADCLDLVLKNAGNFLHEIIVVAYSDIRPGISEDLRGRSV